MSKLVHIVVYESKGGYSIGAYATEEAALDEMRDWVDMCLHTIDNVTCPPDDDDEFIRWAAGAELYELTGDQLMLFEEVEIVGTPDRDDRD